MNVINIAKTGESFEIDFETLPKASQAYVINYGLKQSLNDAAASYQEAKFRTNDEFIAAVTSAVKSRIDKLLSGNPPAVGSGGVQNPVDKKAYELLANALRNNGMRKKDLPTNLIDLCELAKVSTENLEKLRVKARKQLEAEAKAASDLSSLFG